MAPQCVRLAVMKKGYAMGAFGLLGAAIVAGAGLLLALSFLEERIIFHPSRRIEMTPDILRLPWDDARVTTSDGETIAGWFVPAERHFATILFLHGNAGNVSHRITSLAGLRSSGFSCLIIDYRGYGESTGAPSEAGIVTDARAAWDHLTKTRAIDPTRIVLYGESIGSFPVLSLAREIRRSGGAGPGAIVLEGAFTTALEMGRRIFPFVPLRWVIRSRFDNLGAVKEVDAPTLFIHAGRDEIVPIEMGRRLHESSAARMKEFHEIPGARHNTVWIDGGSRVVRLVRSFAERALPRS